MTDNLFISDDFVIKSENISKKSTKQTGRNMTSQNLVFQIRKRNTTAIYPDSLRYMIIEAVEKRPNLWDTKSREPHNLVQRKQSFAEIADALSTDEFRLRPEDIEKQWKNLKDTYLKVKKKHLEKEDGSESPKWRFFKSLVFIDQIEGESFDAESPGSPSTKETSKRKLKDQNGERIPKKPKQQDEIVVSTSTPVLPCQSKPSLSTPTFAVEEEDPHVDYCRHLNRQLKEIGSLNRIMFLKVQKQINDIISEAQIELFSRNNLT